MLQFMRKICTMHILKTPPPQKHDFQLFCYQNQFIFQFNHSLSFSFMVYAINIYFIIIRSYSFPGRSAKTAFKLGGSSVKKCLSDQQEAMAYKVLHMCF